jgi:sigma-B regulation protein RsbU (phosphoserine phosphatase)
LDKTRNNLTGSELLYQLTTLVAGQLSLQEVLDKLAEAAVKITGVKACSLRLLDETADVMRIRSTYGLSESYRQKGPVTKDDPVIKAAFEGKAVILDDMRNDGRVRYKHETVREGIVSQLTVAMQFKGENIGVLRLYSPEPKHFTKDDIVLARAVATQCAIAITNARLYSEAIEGERMAEQMRLAGIVQRRMIPEKAPLMPGVDIAAMYIPCFDVGGDFYDFLPITDNEVAIVIADVIGKGFPAAIMMSLFRGALRAYSHGGQIRHGMLDIIGKLNEMACHECRDGEFVTMLYSRINISNMTMNYCNCGHEPALLFRNGKLIELDKGGLVLGVMESADYVSEAISLQDGDCVLFYTDGLIDAANFDGEMWGRSQLIDVSRQFLHGSSQQMVKNILLHRRRFTGLARQIDDTSIVVAKIDRRADAIFMRR